MNGECEWVTRGLQVYTVAKKPLSDSDLAALHCAILLLSRPHNWYKTKVRQKIFLLARLNAFTRSCFLTHPLAASSLASWQAILPNELCIDRDFRDFSIFSPQNIIGGPSLHLGTAMQTTSPYRLVKVSWKSVQPFPRTVVSYLCTIVVRTTKKNKNTSVKHIRIRVP